MTPEQISKARSMTVEAKQLRSAADVVDDSLQDFLRSLCPVPVGTVVRKRGAEHQVSSIKCSLWDGDKPRVWYQYYGRKRTKTGWHAAECYLGSDPTDFELVQPVN